MHPGLEDGKYYIQPAGDPNEPIGADYGLDHLYHVVVRGEDNVWTVKKVGDGQDENYTLILEQTGRFRFSKRVDQQVVVDCDQPAGVWSIREQPGGFYTIEVPSPIIPASGWTLDMDSHDPKRPVIIKHFEFPLPTQMFTFTPWPKAASTE